MTRHGVVTFLETAEDFNGVDVCFRKLAQLFYSIPFCATFGVSCSGHFYETGPLDNTSCPDAFNPIPWGHLNISVVRTLPYVQELLVLLQAKVSQDPDASFEKIKHVFGPRNDNSRVEIWEMRIKDNNSVPQYGKTYYGGYLSKKGNQKLYEDSKQRCEEIKTFWDNLEKVVSVFCERHGFDFAPDPQRRVDEIVGHWES